jgi:hypothetical protein
VAFCDRLRGEQKMFPWSQLTVLLNIYFRSATPIKMLKAD